MKDTQVSSTALTVIQGLLFSADYSQDGHLVSPEQSEACRRVLASIPQGKKRLKQLDSVVYRTLAPLMEYALVPGITRHYVLRKHHIEQTTRTLLNQQISQIVVLGAGFDTLGWRLSQSHPHLTIIEIDHPNTSELKQAALVDKPVDNLHFLAVDLGKEPLPKVLERAPFYDPAQKSLFICEGVLMYLPEVAVQALLGFLRQVNQHPIHLLFSALEPMGSPQNNTRWLLQQYLRFAGEGLMWDKPQAQMESFLAENGFDLLESDNGATLKSRYLEEDAAGVVHLGEYLVLSRALPINAQKATL
ncbi:class I SAM-dependent methyltransferase [Magnetococcus sp. PR-3]|uniref:class I SAM-dependent methyltransferase n=1 Tax=Magnetococcus sp. PR-3 TaxID=3120355 RepID=UPI002FCE27CC